MKAGVSSACLYPQILEYAIEDLLKNGIETIEIFINTDYELQESYLKSLKSMLDYYNASCVSLHPYTCAIEPMMFFTDYERRFDDALNYYEKYFNAMNILEAKVFVFHGNKAIVPVDENFYFDRFLKLSELGKSYNILVAQENVARCQCNNIRFMENMVNQLGDVAKFVIDLKQAIRSGIDVFDIIESVGENVSHIHISDHNSKCDCLPLGTGELDINLLLKKLMEKSFDGAIMLELYRSNFDTTKQLKDSYTYLCQAMNIFQ